MKIHCPITPFATAFGMPINDAIDRLTASARELDAAAEKTTSGDFGQRLAQAVRRKQQSPRVFAATGKNKENDDNNDDEDGDKDKEKDDSFGERIRKAVKRKSRA